MYIHLHNVYEGSTMSPVEHDSLFFHEKKKKKASQAIFPTTAG